jgi:uncharacterized protein YecA (UPF0149 family)
MVMELHPYHPETGESEVDALVGRLFEWAEQAEESLRELPGELRGELAEADSGGTGALVAILEDEYLARTEAPGGGWLPIYAARILAERGDEEAIEPMLGVLSECHWDEYLYSELIDALEKFGAAVVEPVWEALGEHEVGDERDEAYREALLGILAEAGVHEERIFEVLVGLLDEDPELGAMYLTSYGDSRAVEPLSEELDEQTVDTSDAGLMGNQVIIEVSEAIRQLGGSLTESQREKVEQVDELRERARQQSHPLFGAPREGGEAAGPEGTYRKDEREDIGRNDPCWCGSGQKYKHCHLHEDRA